MEVRLWKSKSTMSFLGADAHHQILVKRYIQTIFNMSQSMMIHFSMHWPQAADTNLWPFAVNHAIYIWNQITDSKTHFSLIDLFTSLLHFGNNDLQQLHVFSCPIYLLDAKLQDSKKVSKWTRCSRCGIYLGGSKIHSSTVHLILNLETGKVSPQYHIIFDNTFSTVYSDGKFDPDVWESFGCLNLDLHVDATSTIPGDPTIIFPFSSSKEKGGGGYCR